MFCVNITLPANGTDPDVEAASAADSANSSDSAVSKLVNYYIMDVAMPATCALGIVGNLLSLMVLTTEKLHRTLSKMEISAHIGLAALAVSDLLFCLLVLIVTQVPPSSYFEVGDPTIYFHLMSNGLITIFIISSTWLIVVMAAERYIAVCHPLQARKLISLRRTRASIVLVFLICTIATIPIFLEQTIQDTCADGRHVRELGERDEDSGSKTLKRLLWSIFFDFIPCAALIYLNLCLIIQIRRAKKLRDEMTPKHSLIRYSASNPRNAKHNASATNETNGKKIAGLYPHRKRDRMTLLEQDHDSHEASQIEMTNGAGKHTRFTPSPPKESRSSHGAGESQGNESTQNELQDLNHIAKPRRMLSHGPAAMRLTDSIVRKRPSDNALNSVTATLVAVILLFLILVSPSELLKFSVEHISADKSQKRIVTSVTNFMQVLNFSLNFVLYCAVNKTFRHTLYGLICCCWLTIRR